VLKWLIICLINMKYLDHEATLVSIQPRTKKYISILLLTDFLHHNVPVRPSTKNNLSYIINSINYKVFVLTFLQFNLPKYQVSKAHEQHNLNKSQTDMKRKNPLAIENHSAWNTSFFQFYTSDCLEHIVSTPLPTKI
jgi:hypothetical protein